MTEDKKLAAAVEQHNDCADAYSEDALLSKLAILPRSVVQQGLEKILLLREILLSGDSPMWARAAVLTGLGYLIVPTDLVPDILPGVGFIDDLAMLGLILQSTELLITDEMRQRVKRRLGEPDQVKAVADGGEDETYPQSA